MNEESLVDCACVWGARLTLRNNTVSMERSRTRFMTLLSTSSGITQLDGSSSLLDLAVRQLGIIGQVTRLFIDVREQGDLVCVHGRFCRHVCLESTVSPPRLSPTHGAQSKPVVGTDKVSTRSNGSCKFDSFLCRHRDCHYRARRGESECNDGSHNGECQHYDNGNASDSFRGRSGN